MPDVNNPTDQIAQVGRFGLVGVLNTIIDVAVFNILAVLFYLRPDVAGVISGSVAMINSLVFNQRFTFRVKHVGKERIVYFFVITIFGLYVIRPLVINFFTKLWLGPAGLTYQATSLLHLPFTREFDTRNLALAAAIVIVLFYNYIMYKKFVFNGR